MTEASLYNSDERENRKVQDTQMNLWCMPIGYVLPYKVMKMELGQLWNNV